MMIDLDLVFDYPNRPMRFKLQVSKGERIAVLGESGAGKSTLLNLIAGFEQAVDGRLYLNGEDHFATEPAERPISMLFQEHNLFEHLTVEQNIGLALAAKLRFTQDEQQKIRDIAAQMGIDDLLSCRADRLSGGQKQRVALARTLLRKKPILLLDEPFSALDPLRREELQQLVLSLCQAQNLTLLMVTHQFNETQAMFTKKIEIADGEIAVSKA